MQIRMLTLSAGPLPEHARHPGKIYDVSAEEGAALIAANSAAPVDEAPAVEHADKSPAETAVGAPQRGRGKKP